MYSDTRPADVYMQACCMGILSGIHLAVAWGRADDKCASSALSTVAATLAVLCLQLLLFLNFTLIFIFSWHYLRGVRCWPWVKYAAGALSTVWGCYLAVAATYKVQPGMHLS